MLVSPLRYPGGKAKLFNYFKRIIDDNLLYDCTYCEPYAGGAGLALRLLSSGYVKRVCLNDIDPSIYSFWRSVFYNTEQFCDLIASTKVTINEWYSQREIWKSQDLSNELILGFATYFLNRTNRSGIIEGAGPIGGYQQSGNWQLDARFNKSAQITNIRNVAAFKSQVSLSKLDALLFIEERMKIDDTFCYLDPPYYVKGSKLYRNWYCHKDHEQIRNTLEMYPNNRWIVSYDDVPQIREIYASRTPMVYALNYSVGTKSTGNEVMYFSKSVNAPEVDGFQRSAA